MTIQSDIIAMLSGVAGGRVYPDFADINAPTPLVIVRRTDNAPIMTLSGYSGTTRSIFVFECWTKQKEDSVTLAAQVAAALDADTSVPAKVREPVSGEDFEPEVMELMEPVQYSFWHP